MTDYENLKKHYSEEIFQRISDNPQAFLDLDSPSERRGSRARAKPRVPVRHGRFGPVPEQSETEKAFWAGAYDGFTFNAGDEISAGVAAIPAWFDERDAAQVYEDELNRVRAETDYLQEQHPIAYGAGAVVGNVAQPVNYTPVGWVGRAANAGRAANFLTKSMNLAKVGAVDGAVYGFNGGTGGVGNRLRNAAKDATIGATIAGSLPGAGQLVAKAGEPVLDALATPIIRRITQDPQQAAILLEKARTLRLVDPNTWEADLPYVLKTLYDSTFGKGRMMTDDLTILQRGLLNEGRTNAQIVTTSDRMNKIGKTYVGAGYENDPIGDKGLLSADERFRYREPAKKERPHPSAQSNVQANLERDLEKIRQKRRDFRHNLHVDIID